MSIEAINHVLKQKLPTGQKFVLFALANFADEHGVCWPSVAKISELTGMADKTVRDHLKWLESNGWIGRERLKKDDGTLSVYHYSVHRQISPVADFASGEKGQKPPADFAAHNHHRTTNKKYNKKFGKKGAFDSGPSLRYMDPEEREAYLDKMRKEFRGGPGHA